MGIIDNQDRLGKLLNVANFLLFSIGAVCVGVGAWMAVEKIFISDIVGNNLFETAAYMVIFSGCVLIIMSLVGCLGVFMKNRPIVLMYLVVLVIVFLLLFITGIVGAVFQGQLESTTKKNMEDAIKNYYGNNVANNAENKRVTESWDYFQQKLQCCAVENDGYMLYRTSNWFLQTNPNIMQVSGINSYNNPSYTPINTGNNYYGGYHNPDQVTKYIPESCCKYQGPVQTPDWKYLCQSNQYGPPALINKLHHNNAMNFKGCYNAALEFVKDSAAIIIAIGFIFAILLGLTVGLTFFFCRTLSFAHHPVAQREPGVVRDY